MSEIKTPFVITAAMMEQMKIAGNLPKLIQEIPVAKEKNVANFKFYLLMVKSADFTVDPQFEYPVCIKTYCDGNTDGFYQADGFDMSFMTDEYFKETEQCLLSTETYAAELWAPVAYDENGIQIEFERGVAVNYFLKDHEATSGKKVLLGGMQALCYLERYLPGFLPSSGKQILSPDKYSGSSVPAFIKMLFVRPDDWQKPNQPKNTILPIRLSSEGVLSKDSCILVFRKLEKPDEAAGEKDSGQHKVKFKGKLVV